MSAFDHKKMRDAAWSRFERRIRKGGNEEEARRVWTREAMASDGIARVAQWLKKRGMSLRFTRRVGAAVFEDLKVIEIASTMKPDTALIYLLHECGHVLIGCEGRAKRYALGYPRTCDPDISRSFQHRLAVLDEETEAWHRGRKLAMRLRIGWCISERHWEETRQNCLRSYIKWSLTPHKFLRHK